MEDQVKFYRTQSLATLKHLRKTTRAQLHAVEIAIASHERMKEVATEDELEHARRAQ